MLFWLNRNETIKEEKTKKKRQKRKQEESTAVLSRPCHAIRGDRQPAAEPFLETPSVEKERTAADREDKRGEKKEIHGVFVHCRSKDQGELAEWSKRPFDNFERSARE